MKYRIMVSIEVEARDDRQAVEFAKKFDGLLKQPLVKMAVASEGIPSGDVVVHQPQRLQ